MPSGVDADRSLDELALLWAARRSGVLDALLSSAGTPKAVADEADVTERAAAETVAVLSTLGFVERVGDAYEPTNRALGFLAKRDVHSIGRLPHLLDRLDRYAALPETMVTGEAPAASGDALRNRLGAAAATPESTVRATVTAAVRAAPDAECVLCVHGAPGTHAVDFAARGHEVTLQDDPDAVAAVADRLAHRDGVSVTETPLAGLDGAADLVFGVEAGTRAADLGGTVADATGAAGPDGTVAFVEPLRERSADAAGVTARRLAAGTGRVREASAFEAAFVDAGLSGVTVAAIPGTERFAVVGHR
ncbi:MAG: SAM-dependent methyltransferase [Halolamina sp.]